MIVQIYEVGSPEEARALLDLGVTHIGVLVGAGAFPRELPPGEAGRIFDEVRGRGICVALSLSADIERIVAVAEATRPDILHLGAATELLTVADVAAVRRQCSYTKIMRSIPVTGPEAVDVARACAPVSDLLLLDSHAPGDRQIGAQGKVHDWEISADIVRAVDIPVVLAGGLGPDNVSDAIRAVRPAGVDSKTRTDRPDGSGKDLDAVARFVAAAMAAGPGSRPG